MNDNLDRRAVTAAPQGDPMLTRRQFTTTLGGGLAAGLLAPGLGRAQAGTIKIGSIFSYTGPAAFLGDRMKRSVELFVEEANKKGGIGGRRIELTLYDAGSESTKAVLAAKRLIEQDKVDVIVGDGNRSDIGLALVPSVQRAEVPLMSVSGATALVEPVKDRAWVFKSTVNDTEVIARLLDFFKKRSIKDVAMLNDTGAFGVSARDQLRAQAPAAGINVVYEEFGPGDNDLTTQLTRIRGTNAQAIICWTVTPAGVVFLKNAHQLGLKQMLVHGFGFVADRYMQLAGDAAEGLYLTSLKFPVADQLPDSDPDQGHHPRLQGALPRQVQRGHRRLWRPGLGRHRHGRCRHHPLGQRRARQDPLRPRGVHQGVQGGGRRLHLLAAEALGARQERRRDHRVAPGQVPPGRS